MLQDISGKRVFITGSTTGIGAAMALEFAKLGAQVVVHGFKNRAAGEKIVDEISAHGGKAGLVLGDVSDSDAAKSIVAQAAEILGGIDILINNAGSLLRRVGNESYEDEMFDAVYDLNVRSIFNVTQAALPYLKQAGKASIINTGSIAGRNGGAPGSVIYASAKAAVHSISRNQAKELVSYRIRVNTVAPGFIDTPFHEETPDENKKAALATIPMGRFGDAQDCVGAYVYFASEAMSGYVTGQIIDVNGGMLMP